MNFLKSSQNERGKYTHTHTVKKNTPIRTKGIEYILKAEKHTNIDTQQVPVN